MTLSLERFHGQTSPPGLADDRTLSSTWTSLKLTRRVAPGTTPAIQEWVGDATAIGFSLGHGQMWGRWEADLGLWPSTDMHNMGLDSSYASFDAIFDAGSIRLYTGDRERKQDFACFLTWVTRAGGFPPPRSWPDYCSTIQKPNSSIERTLSCLKAYCGCLSSQRPGCA